MNGEVFAALMSAGGAFLGGLLGAAFAGMCRKEIGNGSAADLEDRTNALEILVQAHCRRLKVLEDGQDVLDARLCDMQDALPKNGREKEEKADGCR